MNNSFIMFGCSLINFGDWVQSRLGYHKTNHEVQKTILCPDS
jgi:hypothetical protein